MQAFLYYADKGRAEHPNGTVRFRPSAFKANLLLNLYERRKHYLLVFLPLALIVRNDVKLLLVN